MKPETPITLTAGIIEAVLGYLSSRPYGEVFRLVQEIQAQALPQVAPAATEAPAAPAADPVVLTD